MLKRMGVLFLGVLFVAGFVSVASSQNEVEAGLVVGIVNEVSSSRIAVFDPEENMEIVLQINEQTMFENIESIDDLTKGDDVYVDYEENVALNIFKVGLDEEDYEEADYDGESYLEENQTEVDTLEESYNESE